MIRLDRFLTLRVFRPLLKNGISEPECSIPILMYHSVSDDPEPGIPHYYRLATSPGRFREQLGLLRQSGYVAVDLDEALQRLDRQTGATERCVVLTFDDGYRDFYTEAWPILKEFGYSATVFLPTSLIGRNERSFRGRECLTWSQVRELHDQGVCFGSHTANHLELYNLPWQEIRKEIRDSRVHLEGQLQSPVRVFSYPYAFPQEDREFVRGLRMELVDQGYVAGVTTAIGRVGKGSEPLFLERLPVNEGDDRSLLEAKLVGAYDWMANVQVLIRKTKGLLRRSRSIRLKLKRVHGS